MELFIVEYQPLKHETFRGTVEIKDEFFRVLFTNKTTDSLEYKDVKAIIKHNLDKYSVDALKSFSDYNIDEEHYSIRLKRIPLEDVINFE